MHVHWETMNDVDIDLYHRGITSSKPSLTVITLPGKAVCRRVCKESLLTSYYVWHPFVKKTGELKKSSMTEHELWLLNDNWDTSINTTLTSKLWLLNITKPDKQHANR